MKFLCPNCQAKYRIGPEKLQGRRVARIRCRKCDYRICIERKASGEGFEVTASPHSLPAAPVPAPPAAAPPRAEPPHGAGPTPSTGRPPTAAVPGLPGLGAPRGARGVQQGVGPEPARGRAADSSRRERPGGGENLADQFRRSVEQSEPEPSSELAKDGWFVGVNGVPLGPIPVGDLHELAVAGHIDRKSLVWREGFEEWRPLGKFPQLVRVIDPEGAPAPAPRPPPPAPPPPVDDTARSGGAAMFGASQGRPEEGAGGPAAGSAAVLKAPPGAPRRAPPVASSGSAAVAMGAPSAWADLDEEDDEDEAPTTVRGRVSAPPAGMATAGVAGAAPLPPPAAPSAPPAPMGPASTISTAPEPMVEAAEVAAAAGGGRGKVWILAPVAVLALTTLIYFFYKLGQQSGQPGTAGPGTAPTEETLEQRVPVRQPTKVEELPAEQQEADEVDESGEVDEASEVDEADPTEPAEQEAAAPPKPAAGNSFASRYRPKKKTDGETIEAAVKETKPSKPSLLAGLSASQTVGPSSIATKEAEASGGTGLDGAAISRVVSRGSRSVKRSCWQRALTARAPGVPANAKVNAEIEISPNGSVRSVRATGPRGYPGLAKCIEGRIRTWRFPRASGSTTTRVPFVFVGQ